MSLNQAVVFTKPVHHLNIDLTPSQLDELAKAYFTEAGFSVVHSKKVTGTELAKREVIKQHYLMYSKAATVDSVSGLNVSEEGKAKFEAAFGKSWDHEIATNRIMPTAKLLESKEIDVHQLFIFWNAAFGAKKTAKVQDGVLMAFIEELDAYCINAFYPAMEANFYNPATEIDYYVLEFNPAQVSWKQFRKNILGSTDCSKSDPASFRGQLYAKYKVEFPGRDNFVHGSAGPFEGFVERAIHEANFNMDTNPIGAFLSGRGVNLESFSEWKAAQSLSAIGELFDVTEEKNTDEIIPVLDALEF